jgi:hypothetical protein
VVASPDGRATALVTLDSGGGTRVLQSATGGVFLGLVRAGDRLYWLTTGAAGRSGLWSAALDGGPAALVTADIGVPLLPGPGRPMPVVDGRLYWTATAPGGDLRDPPRGPTQLRSVPLPGGPVQVRTVPGVWAVSQWPWLVSVTDTGVAPARYDITRAASVPVPAGYRRVLCGAQWCLAQGDTSMALVRPDGTDARPLGGPATRAAVAEVAVLSRYVPLLVPAAGGQRLVLYDIAGRRSVLVAPVVSDAGSDGRYLWWATGDHEAQRWTALDLSAL